VVLQPNIPAFDHAVKSPSQPALENGSGERNQQHQGSDIGDHSRYDEKNSTGKNQDAVEHLFSRHNTLRKVLPDLMQGSEALEAGKQQSQEPAEDYQRDGRKCAEMAADFNQNIQFQQRQSDKKKSETHAKD